MLSEEPFCLVLAESIRRREGSLVVLVLLDPPGLATRASIPTSGLAFKRFEAAALASRTDWIYAGLLADDCMGLLFASAPPSMDVDVQASASRFAFADPFGVAGEIALRIQTLVIDLSALDSLADAMAEAARRVSEVVGRNPRFAGRPREWCSQVQVSAHLQSNS